MNNKIVLDDIILKMNEIVKNDLPINKIIIGKDEAVKLFYSYHKAFLFHNINHHIMRVL